MKKTMTMLLTAAMILSMSVTAFAAEAKYSVSVDDDLLTVNNGETKATYQLEDSKLSLSKSNDGGIALSFRWMKMLISKNFIRMAMLRLK